MNLLQLKTTQFDHRYYFSQPYQNQDIGGTKNPYKQAIPVIVADYKNTFYLIDSNGQELDNNEKHPCLVYTVNNTEDITDLLLSSHHKLCTTVMTQLQLYKHLKKTNLNVSGYLEHMGIPVHSAINVECKRILEIPIDIQAFCHEKKLGFKQCLNLAHIPHTILNTVFEWRSQVQVTATYFDTWCRYIRQSWDKKVDLSVYLKELGIPNILELPLSPSQRSKKIHELLFETQHPLLTEQNKKIQLLAEQVDFDLDWDKNLETKHIRIRLDIKRLNELETSIHKLKQNKSNIRDILNLL